MSKQVLIKSRAVAVFILMNTTAKVEVYAQGFAFPSSDGVLIESKSFSEWEIDFSRATGGLSEFNNLLIHLGKAQGEARKLNKHFLEKPNGS